MAGFASIIDAVGGLTVDVGPDPIPIGGITPIRQARQARRLHPRRGPAAQTATQALAVRPLAHRHHRLHPDGPPALPAAEPAGPEERRRRADQLPGIAAATTDSVSTNIPQAGPAGAGRRWPATADRWRWRACRSTRTCPTRTERRAVQHRPRDVDYMREVVQGAITAPAPAPAPTTTQAPPAPLPRAGANPTPTARTLPPQTGATPTEAPPVRGERGQSWPDWPTPADQEWAPAGAPGVLHLRAAPGAVAGAPHGQARSRRGARGSAGR